MLVDQYLAILRHHYAVFLESTFHLQRHILLAAKLRVLTKWQPIKRRKKLRAFLHRVDALLRLAAVSGYPVDANFNQHLTNRANYGIPFRLGGNSVIGPDSRTN